MVEGVGRWGRGGGVEGHDSFLPFFARGIMSDLAKALTFKGSKIIGEGEAEGGNR